MLYVCVFTLLQINNRPNILYKNDAYKGDHEDFRVDFYKQCKLIPGRKEKEKKKRKKKKKKKRKRKRRRLGEEEGEEDQ